MRSIDANGIKISRSHDLAFSTAASTLFEFFESVLQIPPFPFQIIDPPVLIDVVFTQGLIKFLQVPIQVLLFGAPACLRVVHVFYSFGFLPHVKACVRGIVCVGQDVLGLLFQNLDVSFMPHRVVDLVDLCLLVVDGVAQFT